MTEHWWPVQAISLDHFAPEEFGDAEHAARMDRTFLVLLDTLRERCGFALEVTSGYRTPEDEAALYAPEPAPDSPHTRGVAADLVPAGSLSVQAADDRRSEILYHALWLRRHGVWSRLGLELGTDHVHVDNDYKLRRPHTWPGASK